MKPKILLVDDMEEILAPLRKLLRSCELTEARDGKSAVELAAAGSPDLVLLDYHLPDMSGAEVLEKLRLMTPPPVVIIMTGDDTVETAGISLAAGAFAHITKPFESKDILDLVIKGLEFAEKERAKRAQ
jgi:CheY-like chemotaxis protein